VATPRAPPDVVAVLGLVALGAAVGVDVVLPHADASRTAAVAANIRTVNADLVMAPPGGFIQGHVNHARMVHRTWSMGRGDDTPVTYLPGVARGMPSCL